MLKNIFCPRKPTSTDLGVPAAQGDDTTVQGHDTIAPGVPTAQGDNTPRKGSVVQQLVHRFKSKEDLSVSERKRQLALQNQVWTQGPIFQCVIGITICVNTVTLGLEMDYAEEYPDFFVAFENLVTVVFVLELLLRLKVEGARSYFRDPSSIVDFLLVMMSVIDVWILTIISQKSNLRIVSLLRSVRMMRLARLVRLFRIFKELTIIVRGIATSWKAIFWASVFLLLLIYIFGICGTLFFGRASKCNSGWLRRLAKKSSGSFDGDDSVDECDVYEFPQHSQRSLFGSLAHSMLTLSMCTTEGCGFAVIGPMVHENPWVLLFWCLFYFVTVFGIMNVVIGFFCDSIIRSTADTEKELEKNNYHFRLHLIENLKSLFMAIDTDHSGVITRDEYCRAVTENKDVMDSLEALGLHDEIGLFDRLDISSEGEIDLDEFFIGARQLLMGNELVRAKDLVPTAITCQYIRRHVQQLTQEDEGISPSSDWRSLLSTQSLSGKEHEDRHSAPMPSYTRLDADLKVESGKIRSPQKGPNHNPVCCEVAGSPRACEHSPNQNLIACEALEALAQRLENSFKVELQTVHKRLNSVVEYVDGRLKDVEKEQLEMSSDTQERQSEGETE